MGREQTKVIDLVTGVWRRSLWGVEAESLGVWRRSLWDCEDYYLIVCTGGSGDSLGSMGINLASSAFTNDRCIL